MEMRDVSLSSYVLRVLLARPAIRVLFSVLGEASPFLPRNFVIFFRIVSRQDNL